MGGKRPFALASSGEWIVARLTAKPDLTLRALLAELRARGAKVSAFAVWSIVADADLSFKKSLRASEQDRPDVARRRRQWQQHQNKVDPKRLVFIDETWMKTNMTRTHGRCPRGQRLIAKVSHGHWKTLTFVAALRCDGIVAPCLLRQPINAISFLAWVTQFLVPTLRPGDVVIMDNLSSHKRREIRAAIRAAGALLLFLPAHSPDLNPIEQVFAKIKALLRKADARSIQDVDTVLAALLDEFEPNEYGRYFTEAGYRST
jgi:transposase